MALEMFSEQCSLVRKAFLWMCTGGIFRPPSPVTPSYHCHRLCSLTIVPSGTHRPPSLVASSDHRHRWCPPTTIPASVIWHHHGQQPPTNFTAASTNHHQQQRSPTPLAASSNSIHNYNPYLNSLFTPNRKIKILSRFQFCALEQN